MKKKIALLFGGKSGEHEVSIVSATSIYKALDKSKYDVTLIGIDKNGRWLVPEDSQLLAHSQNPRLLSLNQQKGTVSFVPFENSKQLVSMEKTELRPADAQKFDVMFPVLHGTFGEDGTIQGLLELSNMAYVGSGVLGSAVGMDKDVAKRLLQAAGIAVVPAVVLKKFEFSKKSESLLNDLEKQFGYPYFVKPANMGSSVGVAKVKSRSEALEKLQSAFQYDVKVLVEKAINARELEVAVLGNHQPEASCVGEIIPQHEFYSYEAKYIDENGALLKIPAEGLSPEQTKKIQQMSILAFQTLECLGLARVDFFLDKDTQEIFLNEINTLPGFTSISMYPKLWEASGLPYAKLLDKLIELAIERHEEKKALVTSFSVNED